jgi:RNA polymerase-binding transcription factor DksA
MSLTFSPSHALSKLRTLRDVARLELHLAGLDARSRFEALEEQARRCERETRNQLRVSITEVERLQRELQAFLSRERLSMRRRQLLAQRRELASEEAELEAAPVTDWVDRAVNLEAESVLHQLDEHDLRELAAIDAALARVETGSYGRCSRCGGAIVAERLHAVPTAAFCAGCQGEAER